MAKRFALAYYFFYFGMCSFAYYASVFFQGEGYSTVQIGQFVAAANLAILPLQPLLGHLADRFSAVKKITLVCLAVAVPLAAATWLGRRAFLPLLLLYAALMALEKSAVPLMDSWVSNLGRHDQSLRFSSIRSIGTLAAVMCSTLVGFLLSVTGFGAVFLIHMLCLVGCFLCFKGLPSPQTGAGAAPPPGEEAAPGRSILKTPGFWGVTAAVTILFVGATVDITYLPVLFLSLGGTTTGLGGALFLQGSSEFIMMLLYPRLRGRFKGSLLLLVGMAVYCLRFFLAFNTHQLLPLVLLQLLHGFSYGLYMPSMVETLSNLAGHRQTATAIAVCLTLQNGVGAVAGNLAAGYLAAVDIHLAYGMASCASGLAALVLLGTALLAGRRAPALRLLKTTAPRDP